MKKQLKSNKTGKISDQKSGKEVTSSLPKSSILMTWQAGVLILLCFLFYGNTLENDYCLDDAVVITENTTTLKGFAGIKEHIKQDLLYGYTHTKGRKAASAGWRPLSLITFSIEVGVFGENHPGISHFFNILIYAAIVLLLFKILKERMIKNENLAFLIALLFAIHPIHTEVVANIKSRDELLCLLSVLLSINYLWKYFDDKKKRNLILSYLLFFVSFTSKESGITFILGIPVMMYFFTNLNPKQILPYASGFVGVALFYLMIRNAFVPFINVGINPEIINNAYLKATGVEAFATKFYILLLYIKLLLFPNPLSYDYSYNQIPYKTIMDPIVIVSILFYVGIFIYSLRGIKSKNLLSFSILMFLITLSIGSNLFMEIGMMMGERLVFIPSIFFVMTLAILGEKMVNYLENKIHIKKLVTTIILMTPIIGASAYQTITRNAEWKNSQTLSLADIKKNPESARVNCAAGSAYLFIISDSKKTGAEQDTLLNKAIDHLQKSISIYPEYNDALLDLGFAYNLKLDFDKANEYWSQVRSRSPNNPKLMKFDDFLARKYMNAAIYEAGQNKVDSAIYYFNKTTEFAFRNDSIMLVSYYNLGGLYYEKKDFNAAHASLEKVLSIDPNYSNARQGLLETEKMLPDTAKKNP